MRNYSIRPATRQDIDAVDPDFPYTGYVFKVLEDDQMMGIVGFYRKKHCLVLFSSILPEYQAQLKRYRRGVILAYRTVMAMLQNYSLPVMASADPKIEGSDRLLKHIGFEHYAKETFICQLPQPH